MSRVAGKSLAVLNGADPRLQEVVHAASEIMDLSVLCSIRTQQEQDEAFANKKSKLKWPNSKHNLKPGQTHSKAVDIIPYYADGLGSYDWNDHLAFARLAGVMFAVAKSKGVKLRWGGDFDRDGRSKDETFLDLPHFEIDE